MYYIHRNMLSSEGATETSENFQGNCEDMNDKKKLFLKFYNCFLKGVTFRLQKRHLKEVKI
jgi:hypothetical protein